MIRLLDSETIGQIAAGEAIERPLSVVKELVENALDAGATRVEVRVRGGGLDEIAVGDDGGGIAPQDLPLAVRRHATSKLAAAADLAHVATLGFRGEGLASIAAVSQLEIVSRTAGAQIGARIAGLGEAFGPVEPIAAPTGTRVAVRDLFANVPVRREFLRSPTAEFTRISTWLGTFALAYPEITFALDHDGRETWILPAGNVLEQRLAHVFGSKAAGALVPLRKLEQAHRIGVAGFVSVPEQDRPDRRLQLLFVNGRLLRSTILAGAWTAGYATFATSGRHPYGVLYLTLPAEDVDPNVHPTKTDVRLRYDRAVFDTVKATISTTLRGHARERLHSTVSFAAPASAAPTFGAPAFGAPAFSASGYAPTPRPAEGTVALADPALFAPEAAAEIVPRLRILAQLDSTYILASDGSSLVLVDQHAAHERIAYEAIARNASAEVPGEPLLIPFVFELDATQSEILDEALPALQRGGLEIEPFGERVYRITATPAGYRSPWTDGRRAFDVADFVADLGGEIKGLDARERVWASLACHSVVRAGARLSHEEMSSLLVRLDECENPMHCPHGRPTIVRLDPEAIGRFFKRT